VEQQVEIDEMQLVVELVIEVMERVVHDA